MRVNPRPIALYQIVLLALLVLLVYDGAVRKWLLPQAEQIVFILKDALLIVALGLSAAWRPHKTSSSFPAAVQAMLFLYATWVLLEVANQNLPNLLVGLWGVKSHLLYASLIRLLPLAFTKVDDVLKVVERIYPWVVIPVCGLAFVQVLAPPDSVLNQQVAGGLEGISRFGDEGLVRVSGTFSYLSGMASFVQCTTLLGFGLFLGGARSKIFLCGLGFAVAALPVTGSRSVLAVVLVATMAMLFAAQAAGAVGLRVVLRVVIATTLFALISVTVQDAAWEAFVQRAEGAGDQENRVLILFTSAFDFMDVSGFTGFGSGSANLGAQALAGSAVPFSWLPMRDAFEEEAGRLVIELGIIGWAFSISLRVGLLLWASSLTFTGANSRIRLIGILALPMMGLGVLQGTGVFGVPLTAVYYWFCVALMAMARFEDKLVSRSAQSAAHRLRREIGTR